MNKRSIILFTIIFLFCFTLVACSSESKTISEEPSTVAGIWKLVSVCEETSGINLSGIQLEALGMSNYSVEFKEDGTVVIPQIENVTEALEGTYTEDDSKVEIDVDGTKVTAQIINNEMTVVESGATIVLEKQ